MASTSRDPKRLSPLQIALVYASIGGVWILVSDRAVHALPVDGATQSQLQTAKGWVFVGLSALVIYGLVAHSQSRLHRTNSRLERTLQQISVLQRVLRHNLRNACNVIEMNTEMLTDQTDGGHEHSETIYRQTDALLAISRKSRHLREVVVNDDSERQQLDLTAILSRQLAEFKQDHPDIDIETEIPDGVIVWAYPQLEVAVRELLDNAAEHNDTDDPRVHVAVRESDTAVRLTITDNGPGVPEMERDVLAGTIEKPLAHSQGIGLWLVRVVATESGGRFRIEEGDTTGTVVELTLDPTTE